MNKGFDLAISSEEHFKACVTISDGKLKQWARKSMWMFRGVAGLGQPVANLGVLIGCLMPVFGLQFRNGVVIPARTVTKTMLFSPSCRCAGAFVFEKHDQTLVRDGRCARYYPCSRCGPLRSAGTGC